MITQRQKVLLIIAFFALLAILPVFEVTVVPEWQIRFVNENGQAVANEPIRQTWKDYSIQWFFDMGGEETTKTDSEGYVAFPERNIRVSLFGLLLGRLWDVSPRIRLHSSYGKSSFVFCLNNIGCNASYQEGQILPSHVIVKK